MQTRRNFISAGLAAIAGTVAAAILPRSLFAAKGHCTSTRRIVGGFIIVAGETPTHLIEGVPGTTYLKAGVHALNDHRHAYFNGENVDCRCGEVDLEGQWVRMYDVENDGKFATSKRDILTGRVTRDDGKCGGWVEWTRDPVTGERCKRYEYLTVERIHFGKVEVR